MRSRTFLPTFIGVTILAVLVVIVIDQAKGNSSANVHNTSFVTRTNNQLLVDGKPFRIAGANMQWLGVDEMENDLQGNPTYPDKMKINNGFDAAVRMHANVVRSHSLGISTGSPKSIEPSLGVFNEKAFTPIDEAVRSADAHNVRLIIPLTDMWSYKTGGKHNFTEWNGYASLPSQKPGRSHLDANDKAQRLVEHNFYTDQKVINSYKEYIQHVLNHKDPKTGVALKDNPTILAWETGNELWDAPPQWTQEVARFIKNYVGAKQLVADSSGCSGTPDSSARLANMGAALDNPDVDILTTHFYTNIGGTTSAPGAVQGHEFFTKAAQYMNEDAAVAKAHNKVYYIGEFDWTGSASESNWKQTFDAQALQSFTDAVAANRDVAGDMFWSLFPYRASGQAEHYNERFWMVDPPLASEPQMKQANEVLAKHASVMTARN